MAVLKIEHIGWDLWCATSMWKRRFTQEMQAQGYNWYVEARGNLLQHIGPKGLAQTELVEKAGISKQAVQQQLDELVQDGIVERVSDKSDARKKHIQLTPSGLDVLKIANVIKSDIESDYEDLMGKVAMAHLKEALNVIINSDNGDRKPK